MGKSVGLEMTAKTEESHHSMSSEPSIQPVTRPSRVEQEVGVPVMPRQGSCDVMDVTLRDAGNNLNITSKCAKCVSYSRLILSQHLFALAHSTQLDKALSLYGIPHDGDVQLSTNTIELQSPKATASFNRMA